MSGLRRFAARVAVCLGLITLAWGAGFIWFVQQIPTDRSHDDFTTDAIVVLTGGPGRIAYGMGLLANGKAKLLFISGMETPATPQQLAHITGVEDKLARPDQVVHLGFMARNTIGNAMETAAWMNREGLHSLRLVTSAYHMPRALNEFHYQLPNALIIPDPAPGNYDRVMLLEEYHKYIAAIARHWILDVLDEDA